VCANFRFNQGLIEMLSNVEALSAPVRASGEETYDMVAPAMKVREFNFTETDAVLSDIAVIAGFMACAIRAT